MPNLQPDAKKLSQLGQGNSEPVLRTLPTPGAEGGGGRGDELLPYEAGGGRLPRSDRVRGLPGLPSPPQNCLQLRQPGRHQYGADTTVQNNHN